MVFFYRLLVFLLCSVLSFCSNALAFSSVNVPLGDWSYEAVDRLEGFGLIHSALHGTRPFTRLEMARLIHEAHAEQEIQGIKLPPLIEDLLRDLDHEFRQELPLVGKTTDILQKSFIKPLNEVQMRYVYSDGTPREFINTVGHRQNLPSTAGIVATEGTPLVYNNNGLIYGQGGNFSLQFSSILGYRDFFSAYVEPFVIVRQNPPGFQNISGTPANLQPTGFQNSSDTTVNLLYGYGALTAWNTEIQFGRDSMWWGQGYHGDEIMTNNAFPLDMVKLSNPEPTLLPWIFKYLGPFKYVFFLSKEYGYEDPADANLMGWRINFKPSSIFEMGFSASYQFGGQGMPAINPQDFFRFFNGRSLPNANQLNAFDFRLRVPWLRNTQLYMEYGGEDSGFGDYQHPWNIIMKDIAWMVGFYCPSLTEDGRLDWRVEYTSNNYVTDPSPGMWYAHSQYRSGYIHEDMIMGHHMGPDALDFFTRSTYYLTNNIQLGFDYDYMVRGVMLGVNLPDEIVRQYGADLTFNFQKRAFSVTTRYGFETVENYNKQLGDYRRGHLLETAVKLQF
jgi:hypothetical protein